MATLFPMAGEGKRFKEEGYTLSKPLIDVLGKPMIINAVEMHPKCGDKIVFICRDFHIKAGVDKEIKRNYPNAVFIVLDYLTEGQASTCLLAKDHIDKSEELMIGSCDNGFIWDDKEFSNLKDKYDVLPFTFRNNPVVNENPDQYGWVKLNDKNKMIGMSVKKAISLKPINDHAICGAFWFKKASYFMDSAEKMIVDDDRINGEFYVDKVMDHCLALGLKVAPFEVQEFISWGTPEDLEQYHQEKGYTHVKA